VIAGDDTDSQVRIERIGDLSQAGNAWILSAAFQARNIRLNGAYLPGQLPRVSPLMIRSRAI
jgi:hypothetical protein